MLKKGEQLIPGISSKRLVEEHTARYEFVKNFCKDKIVLDIACGSGYGTKLLSEEAKKVIGVDISKKVIEFAIGNYSSDKTKYVVSDCSLIDFPKKYFDIIVSFETIEHLEREKLEMFMEKCESFLRDDGAMYISTPNKKITSPFTDFPLNKFHVHEFSKKELENLLKKHFVNIEFFGQRFVPKIYTFYFVRKFVRILEMVLRKDFKLYTERTTPEIKKWTSNGFEPRILFLKCKKYG